MNLNQWILKKKNYSDIYYNSDDNNSNSDDNNSNSDDSDSWDFK